MSTQQDGKRRPGYPEAAVVSGDGSAENPFVLDLAGGPVTLLGDCQDEPGEPTTGLVEAEARHGDRCPACGRGRVLSEDGSSGGRYLYCPARGCRWTQDL